MIILNNLIFFLSCMSIVCVFFMNPIMILIASLIKGKKRIKRDAIQQSISLIIVARNCEDLIIEKFENSLSLNYPSANYEIIIFSDGSTDRTVERIIPFLSNNVRLFSSSTHKGKTFGMNRAVEESKGEILVFSDVDALLDQDAIVNIVQHFSDVEIGGVCGHRKISEKEKPLASAQIHYFSLEKRLKIIESYSGSITSNDGKLYAVRRELFCTVPSAVTDDLYTALNVIKQKKRFIFESSAQVFVKLPSRTAKHEIQRRRRIVSRSLRGIFLMRSLLNPFKYGFFSIDLFINKILRRFLPVFFSCCLSAAYIFVFKDQSISYSSYSKYFFILSVCYILWF